jgi:hypothetical protein
MTEINITINDIEAKIPLIEALKFPSFHNPNVGKSNIVARDPLLGNVSEIRNCKTAINK